MSAAKCVSDFNPTTDNPHLALRVELWGVYCQDFGENWPRYNRTALHLCSNPPKSNGVLSKQCSHHIHVLLKERVHQHLGITTRRLLWHSTTRFNTGTLKYGLLKINYWHHFHSLRLSDAYICVNKVINTASDNGLSPGQRQAIIWINAGILWIGPEKTNLSEILIESHLFSFKKMHLKMSSANGGHFVSASMCWYKIL